MPRQMILDKALADAPYRIVEDPDASPAARTAVPLERWLALHQSGVEMTETGVILYGDSDISLLQDTLDNLPFVAVNFPKFTDGRGYSHARRLRALWGYKGLILAFGDVLRDQVLYMSRCGINGFYMRDDQDLQASLAAFELYTSLYQYNT